MTPLFVVLAALINIADLPGESPEMAAASPAQAVPSALARRHRQFPGCLPLSHPSMPKSALAFRTRLDKNNELFAILCEPAPYNFPYAIYIVNNGHMEEAERMLFAEYSDESGWYGSNVLYNPWFDREHKLLRGFSKSRGFGDCGSKSAYKWDGDMLIMMEYRYKSKCDGDIEAPFPSLYSRRK